MPHVIIKMHAGRSDAQKAALAELITQAVMDGAKCGEAAVSVGIEDIAPADWTAQVWEPDIAAKTETLFKRPGYGTL